MQFENLYCNYPPDIRHRYVFDLLLLLITFARLVTEALEKMKGKIPEIASSHVSSRVLQVIC